MTYTRDGTDEREFTKATLPKPTKTPGYGVRKQGSQSVEEVMAKTNRDFDENGLIT